jgi:hypothetical protein
LVLILHREKQTSTRGRGRESERFVWELPFAGRRPKAPANALLPTKIQNRFSAIFVEMSLKIVVNRLSGVVFSNF